MRKWSKRILKVLAAILVLIVLLLLLLHTPWAQRSITHYAESYLQNKLQTPVRIAALRFRLPARLELSKVYLEDQHRDTLLYAGNILLHMDLPGLIWNRVQIDSLHIGNATINLYRKGTDSAFNYSYIISAFSSGGAGDSTNSDISLRHILLRNVRFSLKDDNAGYSTILQSEEFSASLSAFDPSRFRFHLLQSAVKKTSLLVTSYERSVPSAIKDVVIPTDTMDIRPGHMQITDSYFSFSNQKSRQQTALLLGNVQVKAALFSYDHSMILIDSLQAAAVAVNVKMPEKPDTSSSDGGNGWRVAIKQGQFSNSRFTFNDPRSAPTKRGIDYAHLDLQQLELNASYIVYADTLMAANIRRLAFTDQSGFRLDSLRTNFAWSHGMLIANKLFLHTPLSQISGEAEKETVTVSRARIAMSDVLMIYPALHDYKAMQQYHHSFISADGSLKKTSSGYDLVNVKLSALHGSNIRISGNVNVQREQFDLQVSEATVPYQDIIPWLPASLLQQVQLPKQVKIKGQFSGTAAGFHTNSQLLTERGTVALIGSFHRNPATYDLEIGGNSLQLDYLLKEQWLPKQLTGKLYVNGQGLDKRTLKGTFKGNISQALLNNYTYRNISFSASADKENVQGSWQVEDDNLGMHGSASMLKDDSLNVLLYIDTMNLATLQLYKQISGVKGGLELHLNNMDPVKFSGSAMMRGLAVSSDSLYYELGDMDIRSEQLNGRRSTYLQSPYATAQLTSGTDIINSVKDFTTQLKSYFNNAIPFRHTGQVYLLATLRAHPLLNNLLPEYQISDSVNIRLSYDSAKTPQLTGNIRTDTIRANTLQLANARLLISGTDRKLEATGAASGFSIAGLPLDSVSLGLTSSGGEYSLITESRQAGKQQPWFKAGVTLKDTLNNYRLRIIPGSLTANYLPLITNTDHNIWFNPKGLIVDNLRLSSNNEQVYVSSDSLIANAPLHVNIANLQLSTILHSLGKDTMLAGGVINAKTLVSGYAHNNLHYQGDLTVKDIRLYQYAVGDFSFNVTNAAQGELLVKGALTGTGTDVRTSGGYKMNNTLNIEVAVNALPAHLLQYASKGLIDSTTGGIKGKVKISGNAIQPQLNGYLITEGISFYVPRNNIRYQLQADTLLLTGKQLQLRNMRLTDPQQHPLFISGNAGYTEDWRNLVMDLRLATDDLHVLHTNAATTSPIYGNGFIKSTLHVKGDVTAPSVSGTVQLNGSSNITYLLRKDQQAVAETNRLVSFMNLQDSARRASVLADLRSDIKADSSKRALANINSYFSNIALNVATDPKASINILLDELNGDRLNLKGDARLFTRISPEGKLTVNGVYQVEEGTYDFTYQQLLKRKFRIDKSSSISWSGDPERAELNMHARYDVNASPYGLVENVIPGSQSHEAYHRSMPFEVVLNIQGNFSRMRISFDIVPKADNQSISRDVLNNINTQLEQLRNDSSEMTKQAFSLLLLNQFSSSHGPEFLSGGGSTSSAVLGSVSQLLARQLNLLAAGVLKRTHTILNINPYSDYLDQQNKLRTGVNVALTQQLIKDRLEISLARNFELSGYAQTSSQLLDNINANYKLTSDGRFRLRAYRRSAQEVLLEGYVIETGVSFVITMDYQRFNELFRSNKDSEKTK